MTEGTQARPERVMVLEPDAERRQMLAQTLMQSGFRCFMADSVHDALPFYQDRQNSACMLTILNARLPWCESVELLSRAQENDWPVLFLTAEAANVAHLQSLFDLPCDALVHPFSPKQLMNAVDRYVIYDDVNFIKGGWINRNRILMGSEVKYFNLPMQGASPFKKINEVGVQPPEQWVKGSLDKLRLAYRKAPCYGQAMPLAEDILTCGSTNLAEFLAYSIRAVAAYLEMNTEFVISSTLKKDNALHGQDKVLAICKELGATEYYNAIGGQQLYSKEDFARQGIQLSFLDTRPIRYAQGSGEFQPNLSILDVLMYNPKEQVQEMLREYDLR